MTTTRTITVEALAAALIPVTRGLWGIDDMTTWRKRTAAAIFAALPAEPAGDALREALERIVPAFHGGDQIRSHGNQGWENCDDPICRQARAALAATPTSGQGGEPRDYGYPYAADDERAGG